MEINEIKPKILLADDSVTIRKVFEMSFADEKVEVFTANDGESAMLKFVETQPDIVLAHVGLPGTNGYQICEMIKQDETTRHIPVILLVGSFEPFDAAEAERVMADGHLTKPFASVRNLVAYVKGLLGRTVPPVVSSGDDDIDDLYKSSFTQTPELDDFETVGDAPGASHFDDEMIEAFSPAGTNVESRGAQVTAATTAEQSREFDWSPEAVIAQPEAGVTQGDPAALEHRPAFEASEGNSATAAAVAPVDSPSEIEDSAPLPNESETHKSDIPEPSPEFIALVAERVVDRLSDKVVREIARDAVPRIAEKLMREVLDRDKKQ